jgi:hypothetical protein
LTVVEGSVINIATAIPLLKPLAELVMAKTLFSSRNGAGGPSSNAFSFNSLVTFGGSKLVANSHATAIELAARLPGVGPKTGYQDLESSSQENILGPTMGKSTVWTDSNLEEEIRGGAKVPHDQGAGIMRTQET